MGRVCMGRVGYGPSLSWAEFVMGRDVQLPATLFHIFFLFFFIQFNVPFKIISLIETGQSV